MRNHSHLRKSLIATAVMMAFAAMPFSLMAQSTSPSSMQQSTSNTDQSTMSPSNETVPGKVDDGWITTKVKSKFAAAKGVRAKDISVSTTDGKVTLTGTATSKTEKNHAIRIAKGVKGVKSVDASGLTVSEAGSTPSSNDSSSSSK
ncbi:MAG TPA: BON domain-containing protein [Dyella sp.]|uniref:BON domain-containing protein n=1 Tax=Dyella sp. TaxID=1869338 RepID=UPI002CEEA1C5|nr:BON domain-containing protein [Dyella sp.]HUB91010.1 BON domain-containing protein [Dyella sp.]